MKKKLIYLMILLIALAILAACNDSNEDNGATEEPNNETETATESINEESNDQVNEEEEETDSADENVDDSDLEITMEDQEGLGIGDTGTFETVLGTFELTVDSAEIIETELDGREIQLGEFLLLDITIKNIDEKTLVAEDIFESMEATHDNEGSGYYNMSSYFESVEDFEGNIEPGEEMSAQFITDLLKADEYYFRKNPGNIAAGYSNQVIWTIPAEEANKVSIIRLSIDTD